ncbi:MAG: hypothetical protein LBE82_03540, partial [Chitinophagaceae bacterium]|nr:hypothetical protein [Chitinophagaceae bacterium]
MSLERIKALAILPESPFSMSYHLLFSGRKIILRGEESLVGGVAEGGYQVGIFCLTNKFLRPLQQHAHPPSHL